MDDVRLDAMARLGPAVALEVRQLRDTRAPLTRAQGLCNLATELLRVGAPQEALECARAAHELYTTRSARGLWNSLVGSTTDAGSATRGRTSGVADALWREGSALVDLQRYDEALDPLRYAVHHYVTSGEHDKALHAGGCLVGALVASGRADEAWALLDAEAVRAERAGRPSDAADWRGVRSRQEAWSAADPQVVEDLYLVAVRESGWIDVAGTASALAGIHDRRGEPGLAIGYAEAAVQAYERLPSDHVRIPEALARGQLGWLTRDSTDDDRGLALIERAESDLRALGDDESADHCVSLLVHAYVSRDGWGAASAWAQLREQESGRTVPLHAGNPLHELWEDGTTVERARSLLRGADADTATSPHLLQALGVCEARWGDADLALALIDRAHAAAGTDDERHGIEHDRAMTLLTRDESDAGAAELARLIEVARTQDRAGYVGGLSHELAAWHGRRGELDPARRLYSTALDAGAVGVCDVRDCELNLSALAGEPAPVGFTAYRSGGFTMTWCDGTCRT